MKTVQNDPTHPSRESELTGLGLSVLSAAFFGTLAILAKLGYEEGAGSIPLLAGRFAVAGALLLIFHVITRRPLVPSRRVVLRIALLGGLGYAFEASLFFAALTRAPAGVVSLIFFSYPLFTNILGLATGFDSFKPRVLFALALGSVGVAFVFSVSGADTVGLLLALGAALSVAIYFLAAQILMRGVPATLGATWTSVGAAVSLGIAALISGQRFPIGAIPAATALGLATVLSFVALYAAIARIGSSKSSIAQMFEPLVTVLLAALFLSEPITWRIALGAGFIVAALPLLAAPSRADDVPPAPDSL
jgi:drug/metabolite transporter (DMT)-like permease